MFVIHFNSFNVDTERLSNLLQPVSTKSGFEPRQLLPRVNVYTVLMFDDPAFS